MKPVCSALGVASSHAAQLLVRPADSIDGRTMQTVHQPADAILVNAVRAEITPLQTYGYRRAGALVKPHARLDGPASNQSQAVLSRDESEQSAATQGAQTPSEQPRAQWRGGGGRTQSALVLGRF